jgi:hypothetical protein
MGQLRHGCRSETDGGKILLLGDDAAGVLRDRLVGVNGLGLAGIVVPGGFLVDKVFLSWNSYLTVNINFLHCNYYEINVLEKHSFQPILKMWSRIFCYFSSFQYYIR